MTFDLTKIWGTLQTFLTDYGIQVVGALLTAVIGWVASLWVARGIRRMAERSARLGPTLAPVLSKAARMAVLAIVLTAVLDKLNVDTSSLLAALGAFGLAVGLALRDTISDIAAGIALLVLRPFDAGDDVEIDGTSGTVSAIDVFQTRIVSFDGVPMILPNHKVRTARISNFTHADRRRLEFNVQIAHDGDIDQAIRLVRELLDADARVFDEPKPLVSAADLTDNSMKLVIRAWVAPKGWFSARTDLLRKIKVALDRAKFRYRTT